MNINLCKFIPFIVSLWVSLDVTKLEAENSFYPTWKLLSADEKQHFISGYLQGWLDAGRVTDIAIGYVKENPQKAVDGLEGIKKIYDMSALGPEALVKEIDAFYSDHSNQSATLSAAVTAAKSSIRASGGYTNANKSPYEKEIK